MSNSVFPTLAGLTWNVLKSPRWSTKVQQSVGGKEMRAQFFSTPLYTWTLTYELLRASALLELQSLLGFFNARQGRFDSFLFNDPSDNNVTAHGFGVGDGVDTTFQLQRTLAGPRTLDWSGSFPVYTVPRTNYCPFSESLASWAPTGTPLLTSGAEQCGTASLDLVDDRAGNATNYVTQNIAFRTDGTKTLSVLVKKGTRASTRTAIWLFDATASLFRIQAGVVFDSNGVPTVTASVGTFLGVDATLNGCYRIRLQATGVLGANTHTVYLLPSDTSFSAGNCHFGAVQVEDGPVATSYIKTPAGGTVTAVPAYYPASADAFEPIADVQTHPQIFREDWQGNQRLYPTPRTNLALRSEQFDQAPWALSFATIGANATLAPDGASTADKLQEDNTNNAHAVSQGLAGLLSDTVYTYSVFVKPWDRSWCLLNIVGKDGTSRAVFFNLSGAGGIGQALGGAVVGASITAYPNGWYRCAIAATVASGGSTPNIFVYAATGDGPTGHIYLGTTGFGLYVFGADFKLGNILTSYIPTVAATVTRTDYTLSATGLVTLAVAPLLNAALTWTGSYYWRVRFDLDQAEFNNFLSQLWEAKKITLVSVKAA